MIEGFDYGGTGGLYSAYWVNSPGNNLDLGLAGPPYAVSGPYALAMNYNIMNDPPNDYAGIERHNMQPPMINAAPMLK